MEDAHVIFFGIDSHNSSEPAREACMFGVFDGHGGDECARFCSQQLCKEVYSHPFFMEDPVRALEESFVHIDHQYNVLAKQLDIQDGSTATLLLLQCDAQGKKIKYFLAMAGDSRAVLISNSGAVTCLVEDHVSARVDEQERVVREGGKVLYDEDSDIYRVSSMNGEGGLAVTRAIGDSSFKPFVTAKPEVVSKEVSENDAFILLASDGLWTDLSNEEAAQAIYQRGMKRGVEYLMEEAFSRGSDDNMTVIVVDLQTASARLKVERENRPLPVLTPKNRSASARFLASRNSMPSPMLAHASSSDIAAAGGGVIDDPILVSVARKISTVVPSHLRLNTEVDDVEIPGLPVMFTNDLILWRDPVRSLLWFLTINFMFTLSVWFDVSIVTMLSFSALLRLGMSFLACRVLHMVNTYGNRSLDLASMVDANFIVSAHTNQRISNIISGVLCGIAGWWDDLLTKGSTTKVLIFLRTVTYLYTPTPIPNLSWMVFVFVFTVPATYARQKDALDLHYKHAMAWVMDTVNPYVTQAKERLNHYGVLKE